MGAMLRSDPMSYCNMFLQPEAAFEIMSELGEMGCVQLIDMTPEVQAFQRRYISEVCRCAEMERRLRFMEAEMLKNKIYMPYPQKDPGALHPNEMVMYENMFEKWEQDITEMSENQANLMKSYLEMNEMYYVLSHIGPLLGDAEIRRESLFSRKGRGDIGPGGRLVVMTGVVRRSKCFHFEMMLWRISRGIIYYRQAAEDKILWDPYSGMEIRKVAFLAVCQGEQLSTRMEKVFSGFRVNSYPCPQTISERSELMAKIYDRISDLEQVLMTTKYHRCKALRTVGREWRSWMTRVRKAKAIYHNMNLFTLDITKNCLIGQCWVPDLDLKIVQDTLENCSIAVGTNVPSFMSKTRTDSVPPTYHRTNKFTHGFQVLINAYGDSKYGELNPGLYTLVTFPFFFALMFGDVGHAFLLVAFALWMLKYEKQFSQQKSTNEIWNILFGGRYIILLLGLFSMYTGFVYNDWFSKTVKISKSYFVNDFKYSQLTQEEYVTIEPSGKYNSPYVFGVDPVWTLSTNRIMLENTIKMKLSIIFGIIHMIFGITLSLFNHIHFKNYHAIYLEFLPEICFLVCLFFWLVILIYYKWFKYSARHPELKQGAGCAPQILILFIDMFLLSTSKPAGEECDAYMMPGQKTIQTGLVFFALACVPVLLFGTPTYVNFYNKRKREEVLKKISHFKRHLNRDSDRIHEELLLAEAAVYRTSFSELMIHQAVHTIEFILSTVSHTASYLRLWALSLAHSRFVSYILRRGAFIITVNTYITYLYPIIQKFTFKLCLKFVLSLSVIKQLTKTAPTLELSEMLWSMILSRLALQDHSLMGVPKLFLVFAIWATFTLCILVVMEGLSAFLHTLRLHWVEFMSKFYIGGGLPFRPFSFNVLLSADGEKPDNACKKNKARHLTINAF